MKEASISLLQRPQANVIVDEKAKAELREEEKIPEEQGITHKDDIWQITCEGRLVPNHRRHGE